MNPTRPPTRAQQAALPAVGYPAQPKPRQTRPMEVDPTANPMWHGGAPEAWQTMGVNSSQVYDVNNQPSYGGGQRQPAASMYQQARDVPGFTSLLGQSLDGMRGKLGTGQFKLAGGKLYEVLGNGAWQYIGPFEMPGTYQQPTAPETGSSRTIPTLGPTGYAPSVVAPPTQAPRVNLSPIPLEGAQGLVGFGSSQGPRQQTQGVPGVGETLLEALAAAYRQAPSEALANQIKAAQASARAKPVPVSSPSPFSGYLQPNQATASTPPARPQTGPSTVRAYEPPPAAPNVYRRTPPGFVPF